MNKNGTTKNDRLLILLGGSLAILFVGVSMFIIYGFKLPNGVFRSFSNISSENDIIRSGGIVGKVNDMHLSGNTLFYTDNGDKLFNFNKLSNAGKFDSNIEITPGSSFFEDKGYIYYSNGKGIFERNIKDNTSKQILTGRNIWLNAVNNGRIFYHIAFQDSKKGGFNEYEIHMYDLSTGKDIVLFNGSEDMWWHILTVDKNIVIADASLKNDSGLFFIDLTTGTRIKLSNLRVNNHIISINLQTYDTTILADGFGRVWKLCTDGKSLYAYDTKSPADMKGEITIINN